MNTTSEERKPTLAIIGTDGNAFALLGAAKRVAREAGWPKERIDALMSDAMAGGYDQLLTVLSDNFEITDVNDVDEDEDEN